MANCSPSWTSSAGDPCAELRNATRRVWGNFDFFLSVFSCANAISCRFGFKSSD
jgi:hypothetical protein